MLLPLMSFPLSPVSSTGNVTITSSLQKGQRDLVRGEFGLISLPVHCSAEILANLQNFPLGWLPCLWNKDINHVVYRPLFRCFGMCCWEETDDLNYYEGLSTFGHKIRVQTFQEKSISADKRDLSTKRAALMRGSGSDRGMHQGGIGDPRDCGWGKTDEFVYTEKVIL